MKFSFIYDTVVLSCENSTISFSTFAARRKHFEMKRNLHYNEFAAVQLAKKLMSEEEEDDEDTDPADQSSECPGATGEAVQPTSGDPGTTSTVDSSPGEPVDVDNDITMASGTVL